MGQPDAAARAVCCSHAWPRIALVCSKGCQRTELCHVQGPEACHTDIVRDIVCTPAGIIWTISYDGAIFMYEVDRPKAFRRIDTKGGQAMCSAAFDVINGWLLTGAVDGSLAMWSQEGRCLEVMKDLGGSVRL